MDYKTLELNIASAKDLKNVNIFAKMDVYAVVSVSGDPLYNQKAKSPVDKDGVSNPFWNFPVKFTFNESLARQNRLTLEIRLRCVRNLAADKDIGSVHVPLKELLDHTGDGKSFQHVSYQVRKPSGKPKGSLNFSYKFGENLPAPLTPVNPKAAEPVTAYPAPAVGSTSAPYPSTYPPPPPQYPAGNGYPAPPYGGYPQSQAGYGYPPQPGYGYPPQTVPAQRRGKNNIGMGLGAGLLGGALGGLLIGDMISDAGTYDAGFSDVGGFDF